MIRLCHSLQSQIHCVHRCFRNHRTIQQKSKEIEQRYTMDTARGLIELQLTSTQKQQSNQRGHWSYGTLNVCQWKMNSNISVPKFCCKIVSAKLHTTINHRTVEKYIHKGMDYMSPLKIGLLICIYNEGFQILLVAYESYLQIKQSTLRK